MRCSAAPFCLRNLPHVIHPRPVVESQAVKHKRDSWQVWSNYALAGARVGHPMQALRGVQQVTSSQFFSIGHLSAFEI